MKTHNPCLQLSRGTQHGHEPIDFLRLELNPDSAYLFSYHHIDFVKFESAHGKESLALAFLNHRVRFAGKNLRHLLIALQARSVEMVRPIRDRYAATLEAEDCLVDSIEVEENPNSA